ncbi:hypothetical protein Nepgr_025780 [Nepenthes gracilis]|uniref:AAA+ ATPase domain-containing protein n=1 Tax=Nepenthes gracilis TaxID=150966 RepID=A0AAD3XZT8_NEPGR|nr:hypothetical protein Nepgr_025780 [Nepenthes gracilis]
MEAVATGAGGQAAGNYLVLAIAKIKKELSYIRHYKDIMKDLRKKHDELETLKLQIEGEVKAGERKREMIGPLFHDLLREAEEFLANDEWSDFMDENKIKEKDRCCFGLLHCNLIYRYLISRRATKKFEITKEKIKKMEDCNSRAVTLPGEPPKLGSMPTVHSKSLASRESTLNKTMEVLKDKEIRVIGIYGMGGVGKTTMIEEVARRAEADGSFKVLIAEISQAPDVLKIQQQIAERIPLKLQEHKSATERAREIHDKLMKLNHKNEDDRMSKKETRQVVVILDNMWKKLDLDSVGIPHDCKIVLTTRREHVCHDMEVDKKFELQGLNDAEATKLFLERARRPLDHDDGYKSVTEELVKKCGGLPLAIVTLANTLRDRNLLDWQYTAAHLRSSSSVRVGGTMEENVYSILKWSYNFISSEEMKKFFLLCCLFPLGLSIPIRDLMRYGAGLGLFQYMNSLSEAIEQAYSWAAELKSSSLLLEAEDEQHVKIHDVVREASMSIVVTGENIFQVGSFPRWIMEETFQTYTAISMTYVDNDMPLGQFEFPKLEILLLKGSQQSQVPNEFFQGMKSLKVLVISDMESQTLPSSITELKNLRTLHLEHCELSDISQITSLTNLLFLSLRESKIRELPKEFGNLGKLKVLDLTECSITENMPAGIIARLTKLEGLYMRSDKNLVVLSAENLVELKFLSYLNVLEMHVPSIHYLPENLLFPHLAQFSISISSTLFDTPFELHCYTPKLYYKLQECHHTKLLFLKTIDAGEPLKQCINCLLEEAEHLSLKRIRRLKNVVDSLDKDGFKKLKCLHVQDCHDMEYIVTASDLNEDGGAFPKLEYLTVRKKMDNLKAICHGPPPHHSFYHLKRLKLFGLSRLQNFWDDHDIHNNQPFFNEKLKFPSLEKLDITDVQGIEELWHLADVEEKDPAFPRLEYLRLSKLSKLRSIWRSNDIVIHQSFRNLKSLAVLRCPKLEVLCPFSVATSLKQLHTLTVYNSENMKEIIGKETEEMNNDIEMIIFPKLGNIKLHELPSLEFFFRKSIRLVFPSLESINCYYLKKFMTFVSSEYPGDSDTLFNDKIALPAIKRITLFEVDGLQEIWGNQLNATLFNKLERLDICFAKKVTKVFSLDAIKHMQNLKELQLRQFQLAEEFVELMEFYNDDVENSILLPQLRELIMDSFPRLKWIPWKKLALQNLRYLEISKINGLTSLFPVSVCMMLANLEALSVSDCLNMKEIVGEELGDTNTVEVKVVFPHLNSLTLGNLPAFQTLSTNNVIIGFPSIEKVAFHDFQTPIALDLLQRLQHVRELELRECESLSELFGLEGRAPTIPPRLRKLTLHAMPNLQSIPWMVFPTEKIRHISISSMDGLRFLFPASLSSEEFAHLVEIHIELCNCIERVLEDTSNNAALTTVVFPRVRIIKLYYLQNLRSFSSENYHALKFPSLEEVKIERCPNMKTFSYGSLIIQRPCKISIDWDIQKESSDLNEVIRDWREIRRRCESRFRDRRKNRWSLNGSDSLIGIISLCVILSS